jgi:hypothetical protein
MRGAIAVACAVIAAAACDYHGRYEVIDAHGDDDDAAVIDSPAADDDAAIVDAMIDATVDAVPDAMVDATVDAVPDASPDASPDAMPDAAPCPTGYAPAAAGTSMYRTVAGFSTWSSAEADCEDDGPGTHLVVVDDAGENAAVDDLLFGTLWIGLTDRVSEGTFLVVTGGAPPFLDWGAFQPDDFLGQDCVAMNENARYGDADCGSLRGYVCECDGVAPDPASY